MATSQHGARWGLPRYLASDVARSQRWLPPLLTYVVLCAVNAALDGGANGNALPTFASNGALLLPFAIWLTVVVGNCEDPVQAAITVATVGSETRVRLAKLTVSYAGCAVLALMSMAIASASTGGGSSLTSPPASLPTSSPRPQASRSGPAACGLCSTAAPGRC